VAWRRSVGAIGFTGSHFVGTVFMPPDSHVVEITFYAVDVTFFHLSQVQGHNHWIIPSEANFRRDYPEDLPVLPHVLAKVETALADIVATERNRTRIRRNGREVEQCGEGGGVTEWVTANTRM